MSVFGLGDLAFLGSLTGQTVSATGGDVVYTTTVGGVSYRVHEFKTVGSATLFALSGGLIEYLIVAGGGGGYFAGGGAGGVLNDSLIVEARPYAITVGAGGIRNQFRVCANGGNSSLDSLVAIGGGGSGNDVAMSASLGAPVGQRGSASGSNGGSGGGRYGANLGGVAGGGIEGPPRQGYGGGTGGDGTTTYTSGGGGGGYTSSGQSVLRNGANGGLGAVIWGYSIGGGGAGYCNNPIETGVAVNGGGALTDAIQNSGGGGSGNPGISGNGGSGMVIVRYRIA